jgi:hypothetical protein
MIMKGRHSLLVVLLLAFAVALVACGDDDDGTVVAPDDATTTVPEDAEPPPAEDETTTERPETTEPEERILTEDETFVPGLPADATGEAVYGRGCVDCHGIEGEGVTAPALADTRLSEDEIADFLRSEHPDFGGLARMPEQQIERVARYVAEEIAQ